MTIYTPQTLADRWGCTARHVRNLIEDGSLPAFRVGSKLLRIKSEQVEAFEQCQIDPNQSGQSQSLEGNLPSHGKMEEYAGVIPLKPVTGKRRSAAPRLNMQGSPARQVQQ